MKRTYNDTKADKSRINLNKSYEGSTSSMPFPAKNGAASSRPACRPSQATNQSRFKADKSRINSNKSYEGSTSSMPSPAKNGAASSRPACRPSQTTNQPRFKDPSRITDYEFLDKLGEGTFGQVYKAREKQSHDLVALKKVLIHDKTEGIPITTIREIKILKQLNHENIVPLRDVLVEREKGNIYMVFPYMDHDLSGLLNNPNVRLTQSQIKTYMKQLLEGTAYLHHNNILHRDMKAANLLISNDGYLQIADFGLARGMEDDNKEYTKTVVTRWYRPPELFLGERRYTSAIDMWGVGCVFGELMTSMPILRGQDDFDQLKRIFSLCGSPNQNNMPDWDELPDAKKVKFQTNARHVRADYTRFGYFAADLMDKLLVLDPKKRLTALEALNHDYFYSYPLPVNPAKLPKYESSHDYDRHKEKKRRHN